MGKHTGDDQAVCELLIGALGWPVDDKVVVSVREIIDRCCSEFRFARWQPPLGQSELPNWSTFWSFMARFAPLAQGELLAYSCWIMLEDGFFPAEGFDDGRARVHSLLCNFADLGDTGKAVALLADLNVLSLDSAMSQAQSLLNSPKWFVRVIGSRVLGMLLSSRPIESSRFHEILREIERIDCVSPDISGPFSQSFKLDECGSNWPCEQSVRDWALDRLLQQPRITIRPRWVGKSLLMVVVEGLAHDVESTLRLVDVGRFDLALTIAKESLPPDPAMAVVLQALTERSEYAIAVRAARELAFRHAALAPRAYHEGWITREDMPLGEVFRLLAPLADTIDFEFAVWSHTPQFVDVDNVLRELIPNQAFPPKNSWPGNILRVEDIDIILTIRTCTNRQCLFIRKNV